MKATFLFNSIEQLLKNNQVGGLEEYLFDKKYFDLLSQLSESKYAIQTKLKNQINRNCVMARYNDCGALLECLPVPYAIIKGAVLSQVIYGTPFLRQSSDIDLLVSPDDVPTLTKVFTTKGYVQGKIYEEDIVLVGRKEKIFHSLYSHQIVPFVKRINNPWCPLVNIDVNTDVYWGEAKQRVDIEAILSNRIIVDIQGNRVYKLATINEFIVLCLHHYKDMNSLYLLSQGNLSLRLFVDIYMYVHRKKDFLPIEELIKTAAEWGALPYVYYCLYHTSYLFRDNLVMTYRDALYNDQGEKLLNCYGLTQEERKEWTISLEERLFAKDFKKKFLLMLEEKDLMKIYLNKEMMQ